jgi:hypothetical protein
MLLAELAALVTAIGVVLGVMVGRTLRRTWLEVAAATADVRRPEAWANEAELFLQGRVRIADAAAVTADAVGLTAGVTQTAHRIIAAIPFSVLGAVPVTRPASDRVRTVHDGTADAVYGGIATVADRVAAALRDRLTGAD